MHPSFVPYLCDPKTRAPLVLRADKTLPNGDVEEGVLVSPTAQYPIVRGVARFVPFEKENYARSFGYQWQKWPRVQFEAENKGKPMEGYTRTMWERIAGLAPQVSLQGKVVLDMGCGPGRFTDVARTKGARVISIDYSAAVEAARKNFIGDVDICVCQADALSLPIKDNAVEACFSIGVLHHTPDPEKGVREAFRVLTRNGWFGISVYGKGGYYDFPNVQCWRRFFQFLWPVFKQYPALIYTYSVVTLFRPLAYAVPFLGKLVRGPFPFIKLPDRNWSLLDTFDSVTPSYQSAHESFEIFSWFRRSGFSAIEPTDWGFTAYRGIKP